MPDKPKARLLTNIEKRGTLDRKAGDAHKAWVRRGRTGAGRLDVVGFDATEMRLDGSEIIGARLEGVRFIRANVGYTDLTGSEVISCDFTEAQINSARFDGATIVSCTFDNARAGLADFQNASVFQSSFERADLDRSRWKNATVVQSSLRTAQFGNADFDGGNFAACDFREVLLEPTTRRPPQTMAGTVYERCDFRYADFTGSDLTGATFRTCKFGGAHGKPAATKGVQVIDGDFSVAADGSEPGGVADLLAQLGG